VQALRMACSRPGQTIRTTRRSPLCLLEDFGKNRNPDIAAAAAGGGPAHARHRKYGDPLDCSRRFGQALGRRGAALTAPGPAGIFGPLL
jgi:hypothetical protein